MSVMVSSGFEILYFLFLPNTMLITRITKRLKSIPFIGKQSIASLMLAILTLLLSS